MPRKIHDVKYGNTVRKSFSKIKKTMEIPYFIELQKQSYQSFIETGIQEVLNDFSPIVALGEKELHFVSSRLEGTPKYDIKECKNRDATYSVPLKVKVRLKNEKGEIIENEVFMGDFPLMTPSGSFIVNGAERVVVSQIVRSPGVYFERQTVKKTGADTHTATIVANRGIRIVMTHDANDVLTMKVDDKRKTQATVLLRALGLGTDEEILEVFGDDKLIKNTIEKDTSNSHKTGAVELYSKMKPGDPASSSDAALENFINGTFCDYRRYDLMRVGRYKINKKLSLARRIANNISVNDVIDPRNEELLVAKDQTITEEIAYKIQNAGVNRVEIKNLFGDTYRVVGNNTVDLVEYLQGAFGEIDTEELGINENVHLPELLKIIDESDGDVDEFNELVKENIKYLINRSLCLDDIIGVISYMVGLSNRFGSVDDIDHLSNRRVRAVGELLQNQLRVGMSRLERGIREKLGSTQEDEITNVQTLINVKPISSVIKEFFCDKLSQFMDHFNPVAELTHKRKISALGSGGLNRERAGFEVRDVNYTHYGRVCPIETPEGQNIGLISSLASYSKVNEYGFIESPYRKVDKVNGVVTDEIWYLDADDEDRFVVAQANEELDENNRFVNSRVTCRLKDQIKEFKASEVDFMDVSPMQLVSAATSLIPFLENDDTTRALMGSNMQRQAVPLLKTEQPIVATGVEHKIAYDSGVLKIAKYDGEVVYIDSEQIVVKGETGSLETYKLSKFERSNQSTCINQTPIVKLGDFVKAGDVLADGPATKNGELSLGKNVLVAFMEWEGYNYEDAILISEDLVKDDTFTSIHIEEYEAVARKNAKIGDEEITRDIPNISEYARKNLDDDGIILVGSEVKKDDILVGKLTPKGETDQSPEEKLLKAILGDKSRDVRDTSLRVPHGQSGIVVDVKVFTKENKDELDSGVTKLVRVYIAQKRKISIGDKMAGRHGNKGVVAKILPREDMPFLEDGTPVQILLNPLGVPSRMNIGQVLEVHLGLAAKQLNWKVETPVFDGATEADVVELLKKAGYAENGKVALYDGRTGEKFDNDVTVGYMYYLKLIHLVDDKIHARSTGPYSLITQQPLGGKAQFGGQRFGEMEVWALEAYGASHILQEILTVKSDDRNGRTRTYNSIVKGTHIAEPGIPEAFKVLLKEFQSLGLDVQVLSDKKETIVVSDSSKAGPDYSSGSKDQEPTTEIDLFGSGNSEEYDIDIEKDLMSQLEDTFAQSEESDQSTQESIDEIFSSIYGIDSDDNNDNK